MASEADSGKENAKQGDVVRVHYTGTLDDGSEFDSSRDGDPMEFTVGENVLIPDFEAAIDGMAVGENKKVNITAENAYGPRQDALIQTIERETIPDNIPLEEGLQLQAATPDGGPLILTVQSFDETTVTMDANHPLAGENLTFDIELVEIV